ncbi:hypothetical protein QTN25_007612 [Entamoeba marina]
MNSIKIHIPQHYLHFILALPFGLRTFNDLLNYAQNSLSIDLSNSIICWDNTFVQLYDLLPMNGLTQITLYFPLSSTEAQKSPIPQQEYKTKHHNEKSFAVAGIMSYISDE